MLNPLHLCCLSLLLVANLSNSQARKLIQNMAGISLPGGAVRVQSIRAGSAESAEATAELQLVFRATQRDGRWRLSEVRTGQDRWERLDLIAQAAKAELGGSQCDAPSQFSRSESPGNLTVKRARCLVAGLFGVALPSDEVRIREVSPFGLSLGPEATALVVALVQMDFRFVRDRSGWRVAEFKSGNHDWTDVTAVPAAMDQIKRSTAADELSLIAKALDRCRRVRGFFVVSD
jgi:hypothetical protein